MHLHTECIHTHNPPIMDVSWMSARTRTPWYEADHPQAAFARLWQHRLDCSHLQGGGDWCELMVRTPWWCESIGTLSFWGPPSIKKTIRNCKNHPYKMMRMNCEIAANNCEMMRLVGTPQNQLNSTCVKPASDRQLSAISAVFFWAMNVKCCDL